MFIFNFQKRLVVYLSILFAAFVASFLATLLIRPLDLKQIISIFCSVIVILLPIIHFKSLFYIYLFICVVIPPITAVYINDELPIINFQRLTIISFTLGLAVNRPKKITIPYGSSILCVFFILVFISCAVSLNPSFSIKQFLTEKFLGSFAIFFVAAQIVNNQQEFNKLLKVVFSSSLAVSIIGLMSLFIGQNIMDKLSLVPEWKMAQMGYGFQEYRSEIPRIQASFFHPLALGAYLLFTCPFMTLSSHRNKQLWTLIFICLAAAWFTLSRAIWALLLLSIAVMSRRHKLIIVGMLVLLLTGVIFFSHAGLLKNEELIYRKWLIESSFTASLKQPIFGSGLGTTINTLEMGKFKGKKIEPDPMSHLLSLLVETGWISFLIFILFYALITWKLLSRNKILSKQGSYYESEICTATVVALSTTFLLSLMSVSIMNTHALFIFWCILAFASNIAGQRRDNSSSISRDTVISR